jgi:hypothetical protein
LPNEVPPATTFNLIPVGFTFEKERKPFRVAKPEKVTLPANKDELAFFTYWNWQNSSAPSKLLPKN